MAVGVGIEIARRLFMPGNIVRSEMGRVVRWLADFVWVLMDGNSEHGELRFMILDGRSGFCYIL